MWIIVLILLLLEAHFNGTAFVPGDRAWFGWPFGKDSRPLLGFVGGLPGQEGAVIAPLLAGVAVVGFLAAVLALLGVLVPADWWRPLLVVTCVASILLYVVYLSPWSILPIVIDVLLLAGVLVFNWSVAGLRG